MTKTKDGYGAAYEELQKILQDLEGDEVDVDELSDKVKRAAELIDFCQKRLKETDLQVKRVMDKLEKNADVAGEKKED